MSTLKTLLRRKAVSFSICVVEVIELRDDGVGAEPAMRGELAVLGSVVGRRDESLARHVAGLAGGDESFT